MTRRDRSRGLTIVELLVALACLALLLALTCAAVGGQAKADKATARSLKDATHLKQIHQCFIVFAREFNGKFPTPGLVNRLPDPQLGRDVPGRGPEDVTQNTTANLCSLLIVQNYMNPELLVSPVERNDRVKIDEDYDWNQYNPSQDLYWDPNFVADLKKESNTSYAHLPMFGKRAQREWRDSLRAAFVVLGNRGPRAGARDGKSLTCDPHGFWSGNLVFNDNHTEMHRTMTPEQLEPLVFEVAEGETFKKPDNVFAMERGFDAEDVFITFTMTMGEDSFTYQHD